MSPTNFYVHPGFDLGPGLMGLAELRQRKSENLLKKAQEEQKIASLQKLGPILKGNNPDEIASFALENPWVVEEMDKAIGFKNEITKQNAIESARRILIGSESPSQVLIERADTVLNQGGDPSGTIQLAKAAQQDPNIAKKEAEKILALYDPKAYESYSKATGQAPDVNRTETEGYAELLNQASIQETGKPLSPREKASAMLGYKRAQAQESYANRYAQRSADQETAQQIAYNGELGKQLATIATTADVLKAKGEVTPQAKKSSAKMGVSGKLATMAQYYNSLDSLGGIINTDKSTMDNIIASTKSSGAGQLFGRVVGSNAQVLRDSINSMKPLLLNDVRASTDMSARGLDSEKELAFYLQAATDEKRSLQANMAAIIAFDEAYGDGSVATKLRESGKVPQSLIDSVKGQGQDILQGVDSGNAPEELPKNLTQDEAAGFLEGKMSRYTNIPSDVTAEDVMYTMQKNPNMSFEDVMKMIGATQEGQ